MTFSFLVGIRSWIVTDRIFAIAKDKCLTMVIRIDSPSVSIGEAPKNVNSKIQPFFLL